MISEKARELSEVANDPQRALQHLLVHLELVAEMKRCKVTYEEFLELEGRATYKQKEYYETIINNPVLDRILKQ